MNKAERTERVTALLTEWQRRLGVADWTIRFIDDAPADEDRASIDMFTLKRLAVFRIAPTMPETSWIESVVHELLHVALVDLEDLANNAFDAMSPAAKAIAKAEYDKAQHRIIQSLVGAFGIEHREWPHGGAPEVWLKAFP